MNSKYIELWLTSNNLFNKKKFQLYSNCPRPILLIWQGSLPIIKDRIYILSVLKLTGWVSPDMNSKLLNQIERKQPELTHEITCFFKKLVDKSEAPTTLFSFQMQSNDEIAEKLSEYLATVILNCHPQSKKFLLNSYYDRFWYDLASLKLLEINSSISLI